MKNPVTPAVLPPVICRVSRNFGRFIDPIEAGLYRGVTGSKNHPDPLESSANHRRQDRRRYRASACAASTIRMPANAPTIFIAVQERSVCGTVIPKY